MSTTTTNLGLKKPASNDFYNIQDFNDNADIIDKAVSKKLNAKAKFFGVPNGESNNTGTVTFDSNVDIISIESYLVNSAGTKSKSVIVDWEYSSKVLTVSIDPNSIASGEFIQCIAIYEEQEG